MSTEKLTLKIIRDTAPLFDPRTDYDNLGVLFVSENRYFSGDTDAVDPRELDKSDIAVKLPLYAYIHSGVRVSTVAFECRWDSGLVGSIYLTVEKALSEYGENWKDKLKDIKKALLSEVELFDTYLRGDVYGYQVIKYETCNLGCKHEIELDSCWGFFGSDIKTNGIADSLEFGLDHYEIIEE